MNAVKSPHGPLRVGVGGPVGSGKTALMDALCKHLRERYEIAAITNDIYTKWDAEYLVRSGALPPERIAGVETGGCPHTAIREDASINLAAVADMRRKFPELDLILIESGGDNLAATFSPELADLTIYVIDVAAGDKIPSKGGPGITRSDLLVINKIDLAPYVGASLEVMERDTKRMRGSAAVRDDQPAQGKAMAEIARFIEQKGGLAASAHSPASTSASLARQSRRLRSSDSADSASKPTAMSSSTSAIGRLKKIVQLPFDITSDCRRLISKVGEITRPSTSGAGSNPNLRKQITERAHDQHDPHIDNRIVHRIDADHAEHDDQRIEIGVGNAQHVHEQADQRQVEREQHHIADIHRRDETPEHLGMIVDQRRAGRDAVDQQRGHQHGGHRSGRQSERQHRHERAGRGGVVGGFRSGDAGDRAMAEFLRVFGELLLQRVGEEAGDDVRRARRQSDQEAENRCRARSASPIAAIRCGSAAVRAVSASAPCRRCWRSASRGFRQARTTRPQPARCRCRRRVRRCRTNSGNARSWCRCRWCRAEGRPPPSAACAAARSMTCRRAR